MPVLIALPQVSERTCTCVDIYISTSLFPSSQRFRTNITLHISYLERSFRNTNCDTGGYGRSVISNDLKRRYLFSPKLTSEIKISELNSFTHLWWENIFEHEIHYTRRYNNSCTTTALQYHWYRILVAKIWWNGMSNANN